MRRAWPFLMTAMFGIGCSGTTALVDSSAGRGAKSPIAGRPNEPTGMTVVSDRPFSSVATSPTDVAGAEGWHPAEGGSANVFSALEEATQPTVRPPVSPPGIIRFRYPSGSGGAGSYAPGGIEKGGIYAIPGTPPGGWRTMYIAVWLRFSDGWQGHITGDQKLLEAFFNSSGHVRVKAFGVGQGPLTTAMSLLNTTIPANQRPHVAGIAGVALSRGAWHRIEMLATLNTPGASNGTLKWWVDGTLAGEFSDIPMLSAGESGGWTAARFIPVWGGGGDIVKNIQLLDLDHIYVSVK